MRGPQTPDELNNILVGHTLELHGARSHADCIVRFLGLNLSVGKCGVETIPEGKKLMTFREKIVVFAKESHGTR